ncbi:MAG: hypothetical protein AAF368_04210, partial [Planctomycetota bacterium]
RVTYAIHRSLNNSRSYIKAKEARYDDRGLDDSLVFASLAMAFDNVRKHSGGSRERDEPKPRLESVRFVIPDEASNGFGRFGAPRSSHALDSSQGAVHDGRLVERDRALANAKSGARSRHMSEYFLCGLLRLDTLCPYSSDHGVEAIDNCDSRSHLPRLGRFLLLARIGGAGQSSPAA